MKHFLSLILFIVTESSFCQTTFQKTYGDADADIFYDIKNSMGGGYFLAGTTYSYSLNGRSYLVKVDDQGDTTWTTVWGSVTDVNCESQWIDALNQTSDSGVIIAGGKLSCDSSSGGHITRLDKNGNISWVKSLVPFGAYAYDVIEDANGNFVVCGYEQTFGFGQEDGFVLKLNSVGDTLWSRIYGKAGSDIFYSIQQDDDGGYLCAGSTTSYGQGSSDILLVKLSPNGTLLWAKTYGTSIAEIEYGHGFQKTRDRGLILCGRGGMGQSTIGILWMKTDSVGNLLWSKNFPGTFSYGVQQADDDGFVIAGIGNYSTTSFDAVLLKTDTAGDLQWNKLYGGNSNDASYGVVVAKDNGYAVGGRCQSFGSGSHDGYIIKTDLNGNSGCNENSLSFNSADAGFIQGTASLSSAVGLHMYNYPVISSRNSIVTDACATSGLNPEPTNLVFSIFPNPCHNVFYLTIGNLITDHGIKNTLVEVYSQYQEKVYSKNLGSLSFQEGNMYTFSIPINYKAGVYFVKLTSGNTYLTKKIIVY